MNEWGKLVSYKMPWVEDDGGRSAAGFKGDTGDCVTRSIAIATGKPYREVYADLDTYGARERNLKTRRGKSSARTGVYIPTIRRYLKDLGWIWVPLSQIGMTEKAHLRPTEVPAKGRFILSCSKHITALIDGVVHDTYDPSREGWRLVYGYWRAP